MENQMKDNFPKIPQRFTDESIKSEIARLEKEIANCDAVIAKAEKDVSEAQSTVRFYLDENRKISDRYGSLAASIDGDYNLAWERTQNDSMYLSNNAAINEMNNKASYARQRLEEYKGRKAGYEAKKQETKQLAGISYLDRMDVIYNLLVEAMKKEVTKDEYKNFAEQFRSLEGYKDSAELADKFTKLAERERQIKAEQRAKAVKYQACVAAGNYHTVGLKTDGTVNAVGTNSLHRSSVNKALGPFSEGAFSHNVGGWRDVTAVAAGYYHTVGLKTDGTVVAAVGKERVRVYDKERMIPTNTMVARNEESGWHCCRGWR